MSDLKEDFEGTLSDRQSTILLDEDASLGNNERTKLVKNK